MKNALLKGAICILAILLIAGQANAASLFTDLTTYNSSVGSELFLLDFNGSNASAVNGDSFSSEVAFGSPEASNPTQVFWNSDAITDTGSTTGSNGVGPIDGMFTTAVNAFAFDFSSGGIDAVALFDSGMSLIDVVDTTSALNFIGITSDTAITSFLLINKVFPSGGNDRYFIDNFRANAPLNAVPEPATLFLLGTGLVGLARISRKKR